MLWCAVCKQYESRIEGLKNFSRAWIDGSTNHKTSNIVDTLQAISTREQWRTYMKKEHEAQSYQWLLMPSLFIAFSQLKIQP